MLLLKWHLGDIGKSSRSQEVSNEQTQEEPVDGSMELAIKEDPKYNENIGQDDESW